MSTKSIRKQGRSFLTILLHVTGGAGTCRRIGGGISSGGTAKNSARYIDEIGAHIAFEKGSSVTVLSSKTGSDDGRTWYKISFTKNVSAMDGYIRGDLLVDTKYIVPLEAVVSRSVGRYLWTYFVNINLKIFLILLSDSCILGQVCLYWE